MERGGCAAGDLLQEQADYAAYKKETLDALPKFKFNGTLIREFKEVLMQEISLLM